MKPIVEPLIKSNEWSRGLGASTPMSENLTFISNAASITPAITLSSGSPVWSVQESDGEVYLYYTAGFTHNRVAAGNMRVELCNTDALKTKVTQIDFNSDGIVSSFWDLRVEKFVNLTALRLYNNSFTGDLSSWTLPSSLVTLYLYTNSFTGELSSWTLPSSLATLSLYTNSFTGDLSSWTLPSSLVTLHLYNNSFTGDLSSWTLPSSLVNLYLYNNSFTGDLSSWTIPSSLVTLYLHINSFTVAPTMPVGVTALANYWIQSNNLLQAALDTICNEFYTNRMNFTALIPTVNISANTGSPPSGTYQYASPPTTPLEKVHWLVNDITEGFNNQVWTY